MEAEKVVALVNRANANRRRLLDGALTLWGREGIAKYPLVKLGRFLELTQTQLVSNFESTNDLLIQLLGEHLDVLETACSNIEDSTQGKPQERFALVVDALLQYYMEQAHRRIWLEAVAMSHESKALAQAMQAYALRIKTLLQEVVTPIVPKSFVDRSTESIYLIICGMMVQEAQGDTAELDWYASLIELVVTPR